MLRTHSRCLVVHVQVVELRDNGRNRIDNDVIETLPTSRSTAMTIAHQPHQASAAPLQTSTVASPMPRVGAENQ